MGGITKTLFGGSDQSSNSQQTSSSGFSLLPPEIQNTYKSFADILKDHLDNYGTAIQSFTPLDQTAGETTALNTLNAGTAPTADSIKSNIAMQTNPYDQSVIDGINREANGQNSILKQNTQAAGQFGSNRAALGANDIDLSRQQQIGQFKQGEYNTALQNALTTIPQDQIQSAQGQLQAGAFSRNLQTQKQQAPYTSLQSIAQLLGILPSNGGSVGQGTSNSQGSEQNGIFKSIPLFGK